MAGTLAVLLRDGTHAGVGGTEATHKFILQCTDISVTIAKTPIQIPYPQASPELFDIGMFRPSITISGVVPTVGGPGGPSPYMSQTGVDGGVYNHPYKNLLEWLSAQWIAADNATIELEIGDVGTGHDSTAGITPITSPFTTVGTGSNTQSGDSHTGGAIYRVAIQQARFEYAGGTEQFWDFTLQFVGEARSDVSFS